MPLSLLDEACWKRTEYYYCSLQLELMELLTMELCVINQTLWKKRIVRDGHLLREPAPAFRNGDNFRA